MPRSYIQVQPSGLQVGPIAIVPCLAKQILQPPLSAGKVGEREPDVRLTAVRSVIHADEQALAAGILPGAGGETVG